MNWRSADHGPSAPLARPPDSFDDIGRGYEAGDLWSVPGDARVWCCTSNSAQNAQWRNLSLNAVTPVDAIGGEPPRAAYGTKRLCAVYAGPLLKVVNPVTRIATDIGFTKDNEIDRAALLSAMSGASFLHVAFVYDQSGNGNHAVQEAPAARPVIKPESPDPISLIFDPPTETAGMFLNIPRTLSWPAGTPSSQVAVVSAQSWFSSNTQISALTTVEDGRESALTWASIHNRFYFGTMSGPRPPIDWPNAPCLPISRCVTGYVSSPQATAFWINGSSFSRPRGFCTAISGGMVGAASAPGGGGMEISALVIYDRALTPREQRNGNAALARHFAMSPQIRDTIICDGDSITWGFGASFNQSWPQQLSAKLDGRYVVASSAACGGEATQRVAQTLTPDVLKLWFSKPQARNILVFFAGTNDLVAGRTAGEIYQAYSRLVERCHLHGIKVVFVTVLPRLGLSAAGTPPGSMESERLTLNTLIKINKAGADGVADAAGHPRLDKLLDDFRAYFPDGVHPASFPTCSLIASSVAEAIDSV